MSCLPYSLLPITTLALSALYWVIRTENSLASWWVQTRIKYRKYKSYYHPPAFFITLSLLLLPVPLQNVRPRTSSCQIRLFSQRYLLLSFISPPPSLLSLPLANHFGLIVKCVELNKHAWKQVRRGRRDSPNLFVEMEYGKEKARTATIKDTLSPVFPDKQLIATPWV